MRNINKIFENNYIKILFYLNGVVFGITQNSRGDIYFHVPFFSLKVKKDNLSVVKDYGSTFVIIVMVWTALIILSRIVF